MDSTDFNKIAMAVIGSLLLLMLVGFFTKKIYGIGGHHGEEVLAFAVEAEQTGGPAEPVAIDYPALLAAADPTQGEKVFKKCKSCHKLEDGASGGAGPNLWGVIGRDIASVDGFGYSPGLAAVEGNWTFKSMFDFLENPKAWAGSKMTVNFKKAEDRANVIAYLNQADGTPEDLSAGLE